MMRTSLLLSSLALAAASRAQLKFEFDNDAAHPASPQFVAAFQQAANIWSGVITTDATVRIRISQSANGRNSNGFPVLGHTDLGYVQQSYADFRAALASNGGASSTRAAALAGLESGPTFRTSYNDLVVQRDASGNPIVDGDGNAVPLRDSNGNLQFIAPQRVDYAGLLMTDANAKALGLRTDYGGAFDFADGYDAEINVSDFSDLTSGSHLEWDFDPSDGIGTPGHQAYDAVGNALHEIGHTLGFDSEVQDREFNAGFTGPTDWDGLITPLDLYRYETLNGKLTRTFDIGSPAQYFSLDGATTLGRFSTGALYGNGFDASHWYEDTTDPYSLNGYGLMKPTSYKDRFNSIQGLDLTAFDSIGWNVSPQAVPEPAPLAALAIGALALLRRRRANATTPGPHVANDVGSR